MSLLYKERVLCLPGFMVSVHKEPFEDIIDLFLFSLCIREIKVMFRQRKNMPQQTAHCGDARGSVITHCCSQCQSPPIPAIIHPDMLSSFMQLISYLSLLVIFHVETVSQVVGHINKRGSMYISHKHTLLFLFPASQDRNEILVIHGANGYIVLRGSKYLWIYRIS
ncbi:hypothetical protein BDB01DRAFT_791600 [Pilobolus umbonatus]|nr:hypothetical protein BDB01DRAFT_791600 [Pilobolus umbonatus]